MSHRMRIDRGAERERAREAEELDMQMENAKREMRNAK